MLYQSLQFCELEYLVNSEYKILSVFVVFVTMNLHGLETFTSFVDIWEEMKERE